MEKKIIKTDNYLLVVDESEIKGWYYDAYIDKVKHSGGAEYGESIITRNIIAHLPLNGSPILEGVDLLPPLGDDVENIADQLSKAYSVYQTAQDDIYPGIVIGYKAAKEKYKYTEEDLLRLLCWADSDERNVQGQKFEDFIQSLSQPKMPIGFECVTQKLFKHNEFMEREFYDSILTTTTPEGHTEWMGIYIYE